MGKVGKGIHKIKRTQFTSENARKKIPKYRRVVARAQDGTIVLEGCKIHDSPKPQPLQRPVRRVSEKAFEKIVKKSKNGLFSIPAADGSEGAAILLRPIKEAPHLSSPVTLDETTPQEENILAEKTKLMDALNTAIREHGKTSCSDLTLDLVDMVPWGHYCKVRVACTKCHFVTGMQKLYVEANRQRPGPKEAKGNLRLQYLLQEMPIGNEKVRLVLAALGIRPGSRAGMQINANKVSEATAKLNTEDMAKWAGEIKAVLQARGVTHADHISVAVDGRYDGASYKSWATPGRGATAATGVMIEKVTDQQKVIGMVHLNKTCTLGSRLRGLGHAAKCGVGDESHIGCTANLPHYEDISEKQMGKEMARSLIDSHGLLISYVTTDGDALSAQGIANAYKEAGIDMEVTRFSDLTHKGACQRKRLMKWDFAAQSFGLNPLGNQWSAAERLKCRQALANDVELRCALTLRKVFEHYDNNLEKVKKSLPRVINYMLRCYGGDHSACQSAKLSKLNGCAGVPLNTWFQSSAHLSGCRISSFNFNITDKEKVCEVIEMKLGANNIASMAQLLTTQKVESVNRAINVSDPKNFHFCRNSKGRNHSAIHRVNNGAEESIRLKLENDGCSLPPASKAARAIKEYDRKLAHSKNYKKQQHALTRQRQLKAERITQYYQNAWKKNNISDYLKFQLEEARADRSSAWQERQHEQSSRYDMARQAAKKAKKELKLHEREVKKKKAAANMRRKRTWHRNAHIHAMNRHRKQEQRNLYYGGEGSRQLQQMRSEHAYIWPT